MTSAAAAGAWLVHGCLLVVVAERSQWFLHMKCAHHSLAMQFEVRSVTPSVAATRDSSPSSRLEVIDLSRVESSHWCDFVRLRSLGKSTSSTWSRLGTQNGS
ncbi:hypothetical protein B0H19DRAFT_1195577 [Mycena capillaripes]|nr:hypothetical protein B0H19DRAFT_1195577 [Mycena capillaripes]